MRERSLLPLLIAGVVACNGAGSQSNPIRRAFAETPPPATAGASVAFRFAPGSQNRVTLYRLPTLDEVAWRFESARNPVARTVGFASDEDLVYAITAQQELVALDLTSGRTRVVDSLVVLGAVGPSGTPYVAHTDGSVAHIDRRTVVRWEERLDSPPVAMWGAARGRLIVELEEADGPVIATLSPGQPRVSRRVPSGRVAVSYWGDAVAVATDTGIVSFDPRTDTAAEYTPLPGVTLVGFSPSAHRLYATTASRELFGYERFDRSEVGRMELPGAAEDWRFDPLGRTLLVRPAAGDSIWIVDLVRWALMGTVRGSWNGDLPTMAPDGTLLLRQGGAVVAFNLDSLTVVGRARATQSDHWLVAAWDPRRPTLELALDTAPGQPQQPGQLVYVQVSSTSNQAWAGDLSENLRRAGMSATVLAPDRPDEPYRVVLGPYPTREAAEDIRRKLDMPSWIFTKDTTRVVP